MQKKSGKLEQIYFLSRASSWARQYSCWFFSPTTHNPFHRPLLSTLKITSCTLAILIVWLVCHALSLDSYIPGLGHLTGTQDEKSLWFLINEFASTEHIKKELYSSYHLWTSYTSGSQDMIYEEKLAGKILTLTLMTDLSSSWSCARSRERCQHSMRLSTPWLLTLCLHEVLDFWPWPPPNFYPPLYLWEYVALFLRYQCFLHKYRDTTEELISKLCFRNKPEASS